MTNYLSNANEDVLRSKLEAMQVRESELNLELKSISKVLRELALSWHGNHKGAFIDCQIWTCVEARDALTSAQIKFNPKQSESPFTDSIRAAMEKKHDRHIQA